VKRFAERGGTSRSDNAPHASGARVGAKLACGATPFCDAGICNVCVKAKLALWYHPFCDAGICNVCVKAKLALWFHLFLRRGNLRGCLVHTFEWPLLFRGIQLQIGKAKFVRVKQTKVA